MGQALRFISVLIIGLCTLGIIISVINKANGQANALDGVAEMVAGLVSGLIIGVLAEISGTLIDILAALKVRPSETGAITAIHGPHRLRVFGTNAAGRPIDKVVMAMNHDEASLHALAAGMMSVDRIEAE
jgi:hypothetical protein